MAAPAAAYRLHPDSEPREVVPRGKVIGPIVPPSNMYPNTTGNYWVCAPAQYNAARPAWSFSTAMPTSA